MKYTSFLCAALGRESAPSIFTPLIVGHEDVHHVESIVIDPPVDDDDFLHHGSNSWCDSEHESAWIEVTYKKAPKNKHKQDKKSPTNRNFPTVTSSTRSVAAVRLPPRSNPKRHEPKTCSIIDVEQAVHLIQDLLLKIPDSITGEVMAILQDHQTPKTLLTTIKTCAKFLPKGNKNLKISAKIVPKLPMKVTHKEYCQVRFDLKSKSKSKSKNKNTKNNKIDLNMFNPTVKHLSLGNHFVDLMSQRQFNRAVDDELYPLKHVVRAPSFCKQNRGTRKSTKFRKFLKKRHYDHSHQAFTVDDASVSSNLTDSTDRLTPLRRIVTRAYARMTTPLSTIVQLLLTPQDRLYLSHQNHKRPILYWNLRLTLRLQYKSIQSIPYLTGMDLVNGWIENYYESVLCFLCLT
jgi:hypothetical protein